MTAALLVCDWGSTRLRAWTLDRAGEVVAHAAFALGVNHLAPGEAARRFDEEVRPSLGAHGLPALLCGAIGSNVGWRAIPYVDCPTGLEQIAAGVTPVRDDVWIVPGLRCEGLGGVCDVLRGEETKALGWLGLDPDHRRGRRLVCQPGTHPKWLAVEDGRFVRFLSAFTGELFATLSEHSILRNDSEAHDPAAFEAGLAAAADGDALLNRLYTARSRVAGGGAAPESTGSYLSGLLIGAEVAATPRLLGLDGELVVLLGDKPACDRYAMAMNRRGIATSHADGDTAVLAGLVSIARLRGLP
ncbi:MAG TPA: 2-dehydro-3-deoxygalactonokinase [Caulobacteraceae bacterium]|nr:2-dehydro-3-deoxygalactonokinase [Caulobacteraceae bacterium]